MNIEPGSLIAEEDVRSVTALMSEICCHSTRGSQIGVLMEGLRTLVGAKAWVWGVSVRLRPDALPTWILHQHGGFNDSSFAKFVKAQEHPDLRDITAPFSRLLEIERVHLTRTRQQTDPQDHFAKSGAKVLWDEAGVSPGIMSCRPLALGEVSVAALFRAPDAPLFSERERSIAHILLAEVSWLHLPENESVMQPARSLSPRRLTIYNLMLLGQSRQEIAEGLGLKASTVHSYAKGLYQHFGVHSQAELMTRFRQSGDRPVD